MYEYCCYYFYTAYIYVYALIQQQQNVLADLRNMHADWLTQEEAINRDLQQNLASVMFNHISVLVSKVLIKISCVCEQMISKFAFVNKGLPIICGSLSANKGLSFCRYS